MKINKNKQLGIIAVSTALIVVLQALAEALQMFGLLQFSLALGLIPVLVVAQLRDWKSGLFLGCVFGLTSLVIAAIKYSGIPVWSAAINPLVSVLPRAIVGLVCSLLSFAIQKARNKSILKHIDSKPTTEETNIASNIQDNMEQTPEQSISLPIKPPVQNMGNIKGDHNVEDNHNSNSPSNCQHCSSDKQSCNKKSFSGWTVDYVCSAIVTICGVLLNTIGFLGMFYAFTHGQTTGDYTINMSYILGIVVATNTIIELISYIFIVPAIVSALKRARLFRI